MLCVMYTTAVSGDAAVVMAQHKHLKRVQNCMYFMCNNNVILACRLLLKYLMYFTCYTDLTDVSSFDRAKFWVNELKQTEEVCVCVVSVRACISETYCTMAKHNATNSHSRFQDCVIYLCGTKFDLVEENKKARKVDISTAKEYADGLH